MAFSPTLKQSLHLSSFAYPSMKITLIIIVPSLLEILFVLKTILKAFVTEGNFRTITKSVITRNYVTSTFICSQLLFSPKILSQREQLSSTHIFQIHLQRGTNFVVAQMQLD